MTVVQSEHDNIEEKPAVILYAFTYYRHVGTQYNTGTQSRTHATVSVLYFNS